MKNTTLDAGIPVLTEIIVPATGSASVPIPPEAIATEESERQELPVQPEPATPDLNPQEWEALERDISERILRQVLGRIDFILEHRVRDSLADVLQTTVEGVATEIKRGLQQTLEDVITRAATQEIARLQAIKK